jgi:uncharacterized protein (TIGR02996 family)
MPWSWFAKRFPRRLRPGLTDAELNAMARNPSHRCPHPRDVLDPEPFTPPGPPALSPEERVLLDAVLADLDADSPRLRYAEWCDRRGDSRGEFIRLQIGGANSDRERELLAAHYDEWVAPFAPWSAEDVVFRRGFAEALSLSGRAFISISDGLFRTAPVRDVRLVAVQPFMTELARTANLTKLDRLDLRGNCIGAAGVKALAASPYLGRLRALDLSHNGLSCDDIRPLLDMPSLVTLDLTGNPIDEAGVEKLRERWASGTLLR